MAYTAYVGLSIFGDGAYLNSQCTHCNEWACGGWRNDYLCMLNCGWSECEVRPWISCPVSPILLDLSGNGLKLSGLQPPSSFDFDADGSPDYTSWTRFQTKDGFLVLDRNENGLIDDGRELFGNTTVLLLAADAAEHGYQALAEFDNPLLGDNANGKIDEGDELFDDLKVWLDVNRDNVSQADELLSLEAAGVRSIDLDYYFDGSVDQWGNEFRWKSEIELTSGKASESADVFFKRQEPRGGAGGEAGSGTE